jgi:flagellar hook assembly protein FlgD
VDPSEIVPVAFALKQNIPNPFNTSTQIRYSIPEESTVRLVIYDLAGKEVTTLTHATLEPSHYQDTWDGRNRQGVPLPSGVYFYNIEIRSPGNGGFTVFTETRKMLLLK